MPPKKKGKKDKMANMTEEEKIAYLEKMKQEEEEAKIKKAGMLAKYLQDKLEKEEQLSKKNNSKLVQYWRTVLRDSKSEELITDVDIMSQTFERVVDRKNNIIKNILSDLNESEEQHMMAFRSHQGKMERLYLLQDQRLQRIRDDFEQMLKSILEQFGKEESDIIKQHFEQLENLKDIFIALESTYDAKEFDDKMEAGSIEDGLKNKHLEDKHGLRLQLEAQVNQLWKEYTQSYHHYATMTEEKQKAFDAHKAKDEKASSEIDMQMTKLKKISEAIAALNKSTNAVGKEFDDKNSQLRSEREKLIIHYQSLKSHLGRLREHQHDRLVKLSVESDAAGKKVRALLTKAENIIKLGENCRKFESEQEKVVPFYCSSLTAEEEKEVDEALEFEDKELNQIVKKWIPLEMFWRRFNKVQLDRLALMREDRALVDENEQLKQLLRNYFEGMSVNNAVLLSQSPRRVVKGSKKTESWRPDATHGKNYDGTMCEFSDRVWKT